jgi:hypothetical protein
MGYKAISCLYKNQTKPTYFKSVFPFSKESLVFILTLIWQALILTSSAVHTIATAADV